MKETLRLRWQRDTNLTLLLAFAAKGINSNGINGKMIKFDKKIIVSGANRLWTAATGFITAILITKFLTLQHQGHY